MGERPTRVGQTVKIWPRQGPSFVAYVTDFNDADGTILVAEAPSRLNGCPTTPVYHVVDINRAQLAPNYCMFCERHD